MTRKFKMVGVLMAVVAMFALTASSASASGFTSANYPAHITATSTTDTFDALTSTVKCTNNSFTGNLAAASNTLSITPTYKNCKAFGLPATINFTSCSYLFHKTTGAAGTVDIACSTAGDKIDILVYSSEAHTTLLCQIQVAGGQTGLSGYALANGTGGNAGKVLLSGTVGGIKAHMVHRTSISCPNVTEDNAAKYTIQPPEGSIVVSGNNGAISVD